ncbi:hypothetical protein NBH00_21330 [Paraconexibacter antarcticus]|uniref:Uncharacterized protein n=1 Tax=Paraconexibacter antarcticus TaxID=2949664 RepID=A0ABY5DQH8_9ACTN|nr:hypothetical protein [Paraconexibacter antarcticus]UTI63874.1 hypothetical protein NBH00_21330 [Paraconexibacter antarcticus]
MRAWPPITEPELLARLALEPEAFRDWLQGLAAMIGAREYAPEHLERALGYPWGRPPGSYLLRDGVTTTLASLEPAVRTSLVESYTAGRHPIVTIGSNGSPQTLRIKFGHFPEAADRDALVLTGELHDLDVGAVPTVTLYGSMPAALFESPGTAVRVCVVWVTDAQATQLTWSELGYHLARIDGARFEVDDADAVVDDVFAYVARLGAYCPGEGGPVALAAVPATGRTAPALTQEDLLDHVAPSLVGPGARAEDVVRRVFEDPVGGVARAREVLWSQGRVLPEGRVTLLPTG